MTSLEIKPFDKLKGIDEKDMKDGSEEKKRKKTRNNSPWWVREIPLHCLNEFHRFLEH